MESLINSYKHMNEFAKELPKYVQTFLECWPVYKSQLTFIEELCPFEKKALLFAKGWKLSVHFRPSEINEMRCKMLVGIINEISEFLFNFIEKFGKIYEVPKESWTYHTKEEYLKEGM